uniref:Uncharacterized protein n=1 Tax=Daphnia galeata TaxID=27404 RepID=A0A8J2WMH7_9CRUS|nr:unnamed protein product [Daphnia galeata]
MDQPDFNPKSNVSACIKEARSCDLACSDIPQAAFDQSTVFDLFSIVLSVLVILSVVSIAATAEREEKRQINYLPYYGPTEVEPRQFYRPTRTITTTRTSTLTFTMTCTGFLLVLF